MLCLCIIQLEWVNIQLEVFDDVCFIHDSQGMCKRRVILYVSVIHMEWSGGCGFDR